MPPDLKTEPDLETVLMQRFAEGDDTAFGQLADRCQGGLIQFFAFLSRDGAQAEDLAQETLLRLYRARGSYRPRGRFKTYLYRIAHNLMRDHWRRERHRARDLSLTEPNRSGATLADVLADDKASPPTDPIAREALYGAIRNLSPPHQTVLLMHLIEDMSGAEIALALAIPEGTVKSRMHYAVRNLRRVLHKPEKKARL